MQKIKIITIIITIFLASCLSACATRHYTKEIDPTNISQLESMQNNDPVHAEGNDAGISQIRLKVLEDTAMGLGAHGGLAIASQQINNRLTAHQWSLDAIYNFNGMLLSHGVLPPVLVESDESLNLADPNTIRVADKTYKIVAQARFATTPPNWRDYLSMSFSKPDMPSKILLPRDEDERKVWVKSIRLGWEKGIQQEKMVSPPYVSKTELGVTGNGTDMRINDQVLRITELPKLQTDSHNWNAIVVQQHDN